MWNMGVQGIIVDLKEIMTACLLGGGKFFRKSANGSVKCFLVDMS